MTTQTLHAMLRRQLEQLRVDPEAEPPTAEAWRALLAAVSASYTEADRERAIHEASIEASPAGFVVIGKDRRVVGHNQHLVDMWSFSEDVARGLNADEFLVAALAMAARPEEFAARIRWLNEHEGVAVEDELVELADGRTFAFDSAPVVAATGGFHGRVWFFRDVTERRRSEQRERAMKETAERAARAKSDFLRNMSHEMRTPLNAILGFARVLRRTAGGVLSEEHQAHLQEIVQAGGYMLQLVNDLLELRSLEASELDRVPVTLGPLIEQSVALVRPLVQEKQLELTLSVPADLPRALGDQRAIVQILVNLLSNAGKFTPPGGSIAVSARPVGAFLEIAVEDTGVGIARADLERLFVYFEQLGGKRAAHMQGSGVGLALTRSLVERQGGSISVDSTPGQGSTFRVRLEATA